MKRFLLIGLIGLAGISLQAGEVMEYAKALKRDKHIAVLCVGLDWMVDANKYKNEFKVLAARGSSEISFALYDRASGLNDEQVKALGKLPVEFFDYPCLIFIDAKGNPIRQYEGITLTELHQMGPKLIELVKLCQTRDEALKNARTAKDPKTRARLIGMAIAPWMDPIIDTYSERAIGGYQNAVKSLVDEMRAADPVDAEGWAEKYSFCYMPIMEGKIAKQGGEAARKEIDRLLGKSAFRPVQRQLVYCMLFKYELDQVKSDDEPLDRAIRALRTGIDIAPSTTIAEAMRNIINYYTEPVQLRDMRWVSRDNRPRWQAAMSDVSKEVKNKGTYVVEFRHRTGGTQIRKVAFAGNRPGKQIAGTQKWECEYTGDTKPIVTFELKGSGWFSGTGEIIITK